MPADLLSAASSQWRRGSQNWRACFERHRGDEHRGAAELLHRATSDGPELTATLLRRMFEPINVLMSACDPDWFFGYDVGPVATTASKVQALYESIQPPGIDPMLDFDDRDLVRQTKDAGFPEIHLELQVSVKAAKPPVPWERFLRTSGNPLIPPLGEALDRVLSTQEVAEFTEYLRPLVESGTGQERTALAYLTAVKPGFRR